MKPRSKLHQYVGKQVKVVVNFSRTYTGTLICFDKHQNLIVSNTTEERKIKSAKVKKAKVHSRVLGVLMLPGSKIVSISLIGIAPKDDPCSLFQFANQGAGASHPTNRPMIPQMPPMNMNLGAMPMNMAGLQSQTVGSGQPGQINPMMPPPMNLPPPGQMPPMNMPPPGSFNPAMMPPPGFNNNMQ